MTSGITGGVMVSTLAWTAIDMGSIPALGAIIPICITAHDTTMTTMTSKQESYPVAESYPVFYLFIYLHGHQVL